LSAPREAADENRNDPGRSRDMTKGFSTAPAFLGASAAAALSRAVIAFESEESARRRLAAFGYPPDVAAEIAVYLAQSTDLPLFIDDIAQALSQEGIAAEFVDLDGLPERLRDLAPQRDTTIVWAITDGVRFYRGSSVPALARLEGFARFGSPAVAAHLCQDKFASLALASSAGLAVPPTRLMEGESEIASLGDWTRASGPLFVKPNTLGAKIGIFADSLCRDRAEAGDRARRIWARYRDRALVQPFVEGDDVRVSYMDLGGEFADQLGVERIVKDAASEAGGAFLTMKDNETLSGARDTAGGRGGFGASRPAAFIPRMIDLREEGGERSQRAVAHILDCSARLARLIGLRDLFSIDFRIDADGRPTFFEFEVSPGVTIYDFQNYLRSRRGLTLGAALARAFSVAYRRRRAMGEA
jgi:D-alanine-D-alanine ligase-like ATP-grasp enzyme